MTHRFNYDTSRLIRLSIALTPLIVCPIFLAEYGGHAELVFTLFGAISFGWLLGVVLTAVRFKLWITDHELTCRGRFSTRKLNFPDIQSVQIRQGRDRAGRFATGSPLTELVIASKDRKLVLSSIPLGEDAMTRLIEILKQRLPDSIWQNE